MIRILLIASLLFLPACSLFRSLGLEDSSGGGIKLSQIGAHNDRKIVSQRIDREGFTRSVEESGALSRVRLVPVYGAKTDKYPEYRLFGIQKGDPYYLLGLRNGDVLRAANDYILFDESKFAPYVSLLRYANEGFIDIYRQGEALQFKYTIMPQRESTHLPGSES